MPPDLVKLILSEVNVAVPAGPGVEAGMVVLAELEDPHRRLRIVIAQPEARAIQAAWTGVIPVRPSTWDLFVSAVAILEGRIDRVVITAVQEERHFFATLELERDGEQRSLSCRPSDAVAVALRAYGAEIYAARDVLDAVGLARDGTKYGPYVKSEEAVLRPLGDAGGAGSVAEGVGPVDAGGAGSVEAPVDAGGAGSGEKRGASGRGAGRTRSGRLPRKASPRTAGPVRKAGTRGATAEAPAPPAVLPPPATPDRKAAAQPAPDRKAAAQPAPNGNGGAQPAPDRKAAAQVRKAGARVRKAGAPAKKAGTPRKKAAGPVRKRTPPAP